MVFKSYRLNEQSGVTYVYEGKSIWDKNKKQSRNKMVCIGKIDPTSKIFIPNNRLRAPSTPDEHLSLQASTEIIGPFLILDEIDKRIGLSKTLKACFPEFHKQIQLMAYYLNLQGSALYRCETWCRQYAPEFSETLSSQRISEILRTISINSKQNFLTQWMGKVCDGDYLCYDITSISSYSEANEYIKFGYNRDKEKLPQLNLATVFGQKSQLPVYYHRLPGNITDVVTVHNLLKTFKALEMRCLYFVMDKGFYSQKNVDDLFSAKHKFIVSVPLSNKWVLKEIDKVGDEIHGPGGYQRIDEEIIYARSHLYSWGQDKRRGYVHIYYNAHRKAEAVDRFNTRLVTYYNELISGNPVGDHKNDYDTFFIVKTTPKRGTKVSYNKEALKKYISQYAGFQVYLSNRIKDPVIALQIYRNKDVVEKCFDDLKNAIDMKRLRMHSMETIDGRLFVQFIALIYMSALRNELRKTGLIEKYTTQEILDEMKTITKIKYSGKRKHILTEISKSQRSILETLGIQIPN